MTAPEPDPNPGTPRPGYETWELEAREAVRDTIASYTVAGDRYRLDELADCFTEDGILEIKGRQPIVGRRAIASALAIRPSARGSEPGSDDSAFYVRHHVSSVRIESVSPDQARATSYFLVLTPIGPDHWGRYRDRLVPTGGRWLFAHRLVAVDGHAPGSLFGDLS